MRRTLTRDFELSGTTMAAGDKATLWYCSANRDELKFADPWKFDVTRDPNPHVGFGGGGAHFCSPAVSVHPRHQDTADRVDAAGLIPAQPC